MAATETILIPPYGHTLAGTLRAINANGVASRIELAPQTPFAGDPEFDSSDLSAWTQTNSAAADTIDANTTAKGHLYINHGSSNTDWIDGTRSGPFVQQTISGDFDVYCRAKIGNRTNYHAGGLIAQSTSTAGDWIGSRIFVNTIWAWWHQSTNNDVSAETTATAEGANEIITGGFIYVRIQRVTNQFTTYYSRDGIAWTQIATVARSDFSSDAKVGFAIASANVSNVLAAACDFIRTWPPYVTTSPVSTLVVDSGAPGTVWTPSTFVALENPPLDPFGVQATIGLGTLKYRIAAGETDPPALAGGTLTEAQVQALAAITGRYLKIEVTFISANGYELAAFAGAKIQQAIVTPAPVLVNGGLVQ